MKKKNSRAPAQEHAAVALRYAQGEDSAPRVTAKGSGRTASEIIRIAREHGIPIKEDPDLLDMLYPLELDESIPPELYAVVAEVLIYVFRLNRKVVS
ncbi:MAG: hypothetical protein A2487_14865 [Candidatus Raymondbacteria bacterium RifOxyC12_full_50_8]|uniref:Flagellar biosynthesis protein FlhB n=1 Tax=Candidatus Raymondbacteria bacterium RIFOXYD12_FULL_49_13 TaxID=1817890 RepID=A0A1F7FLR4_UNCRA|nr:MAG: hypothetical protein A2248_15835 [Candidatus Raymondbacteria bacterium RIFOXYA2_FULL_49_16]OGJ96094.1 MAG: hypothetical protein A2453_08375 [Candidatus Raymondbacteria bacterium RIFOXYC2_FULL_50_21]OGK01444.1 MAG: hypothetical protein A2487_14865 [Candidatus Raymondbacteria bacterium RifOxyC12_full_50_8]OGK07634.1 MAG: hypothetical protein A2519_21890 [Candidatus Raymondbacteria bacterium RIFOXYD12_FULL_49_13]OGP40507.1 MAG: hypothetical protein A2324_00240 [Candidatus Raymondbacteria b